MPRFPATGFSARYSIASWLSCEPFMLSPAFISKLEKLFPSDRLYADPVDCFAYAYDNSRKLFPPDAVVFPIDATEIQALV